MSIVIQAEVTLEVKARCPKCLRVLILHWKCDEESLSTGNTTQKASYAMKSIKTQLQAEMNMRGWNETMCGRCRDPEEQVTR